MNPDSFNKEVIRRTVHSFYTRQYPILTTILAKLKEDEVFRGGRFCYGRFCESWGFRTRDNKRYIYEQRNILVQRHTYLQTIRKLRNDNRTIIYTDETWVNTHHYKEHIWVDIDDKGGWKVPSGKVND